MNHRHKFAISVAILAAFFYSPTEAQQPGAVTNHGFAIGKGPGVQGFGSLVCSSGQIPIGQAGADPACRTISGDMSINSSGAATVLSGTSINSNTSVTLTTAHCGKTVQISGGYYTFTLPSTSGFSEGCKITVRNGDSFGTGRAKVLSGFPSGFTNGQLMLWPGQTGAVQVANSTWVTERRPGRARLPSGTVNAYANFSLGNDANDCLASGASACKTIQQAMFLACQEFDLSAVSQTNYTVNVAANVTDTQGVHYACHGVTGAQGGAAIYVSGGTNSTISTTDIDAFAVDVNAIVSINSITLQASGNVTTAASTRPADCLRADYGGRIFALTNTFVSCTGAQIAADQGGMVYMFSTYNINAGALNHLYAQNGGVITTGSQTSGFVTALFGASVNFSNAFAKAGPGGTINVPGLTWNYTGGPWTITGTKALTVGAGEISTGAGTTDCNNAFFPGDVNGSVASPFCS